MWQGRFEDPDDTWLRWQNSAGQLLLTGEERAEQAEQQVARLMARLRVLGLEHEV